ncbi:hypothetical protein NEOLEDRAFT_1241306 [Neolentinus lepideus HHB14362 ss-1]|uniref:Uncharacterized protein n=1 Tax=Neolentinus lepideus HHB14362 ss-1 TaxID=1314782 RepID=A0A165T301_9AGAM|nr:hypothetical protein NEOLEDRAFT_1241306 [Neolentinus lepideus HHB14362 ss-1]
MMSSLSRGNGQDQYPSDPDLDRLLFQPSPVRADLLCTHITVSSLAGNEEEDAYYHRKPGSHTYTAVISVPGILNMLVASPTSLLSWDSWGPPLCRWFQDLDLVSQDDLHTPISGPRMILKDCILDFNAVEIARDFSQCRCRVPAAHWTDVHGQYPDASPNFYCEEHKAVVTRPSTVPCGVAFTNRVTTGLPYRKVMEFCQSRRLRESDWTYMSASLVRRVDEDGTIVFHFLDL